MKLFKIQIWVHRKYLYSEVQYSKAYDIHWQILKDITCRWEHNYLLLWSTTRIPGAVKSAYCPLLDWVQDPAPLWQRTAACNPILVIRCSLLAFEDTRHSHSSHIHTGSCIYTKVASINLKKSFRCLLVLSFVYLSFKQQGFLILCYYWFDIFLLMIFVYVWWLCCIYYSFCHIFSWF